MNYRKHYDSLIERARGRVLSGYVERHHVVPRCLGGADDAANIVALTPEEHYLAHQLLVKMHPGDKRLVFAALAMTRGNGRSNKRYGWLRRRFALAISDVWRGRSRGDFSQQHRKRIGEAQRGRKRGPHTEEHKAKLAAAHEGKSLTTEHRAKLAAAKLGKPRGSYQQKSCPHCGKAGAGGTMNRWHFDNCRSKT